MHGSKRDRLKWLAQDLALTTFFVAGLTAAIVLVSCVPWSAWVLIWRMF